MSKILALLNLLFPLISKLDKKNTVYNTNEIENSLILYLKQEHTYKEIHKKYKHMFPNQKDFKIFIEDMLKSNKIICLNPESKLKKRKYKKYIFPFGFLMTTIPNPHI